MRAAERGRRNFRSNILPGDEVAERMPSRAKKFVYSNRGSRTYIELLVFSIFFHGERIVGLALIARIVHPKEIENDVFSSFLFSIGKIVLGKFISMNYLDRKNLYPRSMNAREIVSNLFVREIIILIMDSSVIIFIVFY